MKAALVLDRDLNSCSHTAQLLEWLGYIVVQVHTPGAALNATRSIRFDVIVTCTSFKPDDRRSFTGELKRSVPNAAIIQVAENNHWHEQMPSGCYLGTSALIQRPISLDVLRRIIEFGIDGWGSQPSYIAPFPERRRQFA